jgi:hypothetical protein
MRIFPAELLIMRLKGELPRDRSFDWVRVKSDQECREGLMRISGLDYGLDAEAWARWWADERSKRDIDPEF